MPFAPLLVALAALHPNSLSESHIVVHGAQVTVAIRCQAASVLEVMGAAADHDGDGRLSQPELDGVRGALGTYLLDRFKLSVGGSDPAHATPLFGRLTDLQPGELVPDTFGAMQWISAALAFDAAAPVPDLLIQDSIFQDAAPNHEDLCDVRFNDEPLVEAKFWAGEPVRYYAPGKPAAPPGAAPESASPAVPTMTRTIPFAEWIAMGVRHILSGRDHIAFVIGLLVAAGTLGALLGVITAFTLAHSITLALAALGIVHVPGPLVEFVIATSIAWVGVANLLQHRPVARWREAFGFGLVHGLGFASFLGEALQSDTRRLVPLVGFNLGVEAGQLLVVASVLAVLFVARLVARRGATAPDAMNWLAPRPVRLLASLGVAASGLFWMGQRAGLY